MSANVDLNNRPDYDAVLQDIADYVLTFKPESAEALNTARNCLIDTLGCGLLALRFPECTKHLGPIVEGTVVPFGARVPGTPYRLDLSGRCISQDTSVSPLSLRERAGVRVKCRVRTSQQARGRNLP